jgi:hypothetical protein
LREAPGCRRDLAVEEDSKHPLTLKEAVEQLGRGHPLGEHCRILWVGAPGPPDLYTVGEWLREVSTGSELERSVMEQMCATPVRVDETGIYSLERGERLYAVLD